MSVLLELSAVVATNDVVALPAGLIILLRRILRALRMIVATAPRIVTLVTLTLLYTVRPPIVRLVSQRLGGDTDAQQTNTGQTPDARLHAFPHSSSGLVRKTGKAQAGSATGYQSRSIFRRH